MKPVLIYSPGGVYRETSDPGYLAVALMHGWMIWHDPNRELRHGGLHE